MAALSPNAAPRMSTRGRVFTWLLGILSISVLLYMMSAIVHQIVVPPPAQRLVIVQDIPLPGALAPANNQDLTPGTETVFDGFDFQVYDAATHRVFINHTGPAPDDLILDHVPFDPKSDGHVVVFDVQQDKIVARVPVPQGSGMIEATDLRKIFVADSENNIIFDINADTMKIQGQIQLQDNEGPDGMGYDPVDHRIFVSDPGSPADITKTLNADPKNQNMVVIDAIHDKLIGMINIGLMPLLSSEKAPVTHGNIPTWGYDIGHNDYDLGHEYFPSQVLPNADDPNAYILPSPHTAEFISINALTMKVDQRLALPASCSTPHGMTIDRDQHIAFVACTDFDPQSNLFEHLIRIDLKTMNVLPDDITTTHLAGGPDLVRIDHSAGLVFVAGSEGITIFDEKANEFHRLGVSIVGHQTHTISIDEQTQEMFFPILSGGLPVLRVTRYNPNGR